jgi:glucose-6-phosphate dehydrogenase assembly protein OpcA
MSGTFDAKSLGEIMREHISYRGNSDNVNLLWAGYLAALSVEGHLTDSEYHELNNSLKDVGREELRELLIGYPGQFE